MSTSRSKKVHAWVHPDFHQKLKLESARHGLSMIKYTEKLARDKNIDEHLNPHKNKKKNDMSREWNFGF